MFDCHDNVMRIVRARYDGELLRKRRLVDNERVIAHRGEGRWNIFEKF